jgi:hypothetical protein
MKILIIVDPRSQVHPDLVQGVEIARHECAEIELFACNDQPGVPEEWVGSLNTHEYRVVLRESTMEALEQLARPIREQGLVVTTACAWHPRREEGIFRHIQEGDADLLAYGGSLNAYAKNRSISHKAVSPALSTEAGHAHTR